mgnify:CR=1 FL=1
MAHIMEPVTIVTMSALGGGFMVGVWYILVRSDAKLNMRPGMSAEGLGEREMARTMFDQMDGTTRSKGCLLYTSPSPRDRG